LHQHTVGRYRDFRDFPDGGCRHLEFSKIRNFNGLSAVGGPICATMPDFIKIGQTAAKIWLFNGSQNGGRPPSWICEIRMF